MSTGPVEAKVKWGGAGAAVGGLVVWALETYVFHGSVPVPVQAFIDLAVPAGLAWVLGYAAKHTFRDDPDARNAQERPPMT
jgi:hypothetical protein